MVQEREFFHFCRVSINLNQKVAIAQEFDEGGNHRLAYYGALVFSSWVDYHQFSKLSIPGIGQFAGTTEYWGNDLPRVFQLINNFEE